ncbi:HutD family protein [uncultured Lutibacter sp.]|uniref:HutD family protein n=1 Tax=uncultured Lutibacter sp. TaxID=437739 RepID=UPI00263855C3|nr:HutD family protein [uncultured Lutibacter sp.]
MKFIQIPSEEFKINKWSGGTTTQLFIYPPKANYQQQNFNFRLSSATVETEESSFTVLPEVSRKLMILDGNITINHKNHYSKQLKKWDIDTFEGNWETSSIGKCTDFNLMTTRNTFGDLSSLKLTDGKNINYQLDDRWDWIFIYVVEGNFKASIKDALQYLKKGDLFVIKDVITSMAQITSSENSELVIAKIKI